MPYFIVIRDNDDKNNNFGVGSNVSPSIAGTGELSERLHLNKRR
jgi:hypothetical protein